MREALIHQDIIREMVVHKLAKIPWNNTLKVRQYKAKTACGKKCDCAAALKRSYK